MHAPHFFFLWKENAPLSAVTKPLKIRGISQCPETVMNACSSDSNSTYGLRWGSALLPPGIRLQQPAWEFYMRLTGDPP